MLPSIIILDPTTFAEVDIPRGYVQTVSAIDKTSIQDQVCSAAVNSVQIV